MSILSVVRRTLCIQVRLIRESPDQSLFDGYPGHIAAFHALHRLLAPRHPPYALSNLTTNPQSSWSCDQEGRGQRTENIQPTVGVAGVNTPVRLRRRGGLPRHLTDIRLSKSKDSSVLIIQSGEPPNGANRNRTGNLRLAKAALSQLSYSPERILGRKTPARRLSLSDR